MSKARAAVGCDDAWAWASTLASWMESMIGIVHVVGTGGVHLPSGNMINVRRAAGWDAATSAFFMACLRAVWQGLEHIGVKMPAFEARRMSAICV